MPPKLIIGKLTNEQRIAMAIPYGDFATIEKLLETTTDFTFRDFRGNTLLHIAVNYGQPLIVRRLVEAGAPVNAQDYEGNTPLHLIVGMNSDDPVNQSKILQIVQILLEYGADPFIKNNEELTPVEYLLAFPNSANTDEFNQHIQQIFELYLQKFLAYEKTKAAKKIKTNSMYRPGIKHKMEGGKTRHKKMKSRRSTRRRR
jgi:ankyrin repeat protein